MLADRLQSGRWPNRAGSLWKGHLLISTRPVQVSKGNNNRIDLSEAAVLVSGSMIARHESDLVVDRTQPNRHKSSHSGFLPEDSESEPAPANSGLSQ